MAAFDSSIGQVITRPRSLPRGATAVAVGFLVGLLVVSVLAPVLLPYGANEQDLSQTLLPPVPFSGSSASHPFGTDELGRDMLSRLIAGGGTSLIVSFGTVLIAGVFGVALGMLAGYVGRWVDFVVQTWIEVQVTFPGMLMAILFLALVGASRTALIAFLAFVGWMVFARAARAGVLSERRQEYVRSARAIGAGHTRVLVRHIGPVLLPALGVIAALEIAQTMLAESALSFLGLGVRPPDVSWGLMMAEGRDQMVDAWWLVVLPGLAIVASVLSAMTLAEASRRQVQER